MGCVIKPFKKQEIAFMCEKYNVNLPSIDTMSNIQLDTIKKVIHYSTECGDTDRLKTAIQKVEEAVCDEDDVMEAMLGEAEQWVAKSSFPELVRMFFASRKDLEADWRAPQGWQEHPTEKQWLTPDRQLNWENPNVVVHNMICHYLEKKKEKIKGFQGVSHIAQLETR